MMVSLQTAEIKETPTLRPIVWLGNSKANILAFPREVRKLIGDELELIQFGEMPKDAKPFKGLGSGVFEITLKYEKEVYRCIQAVQLGHKIYVLHVLQNNVLD